MTDLAIDNLKDVPHFADTVADRIWNAWWKQKGIDLSHVASLVQLSLISHQVPFTNIAYTGDTFIGTASLIESDFEDRPELMPWIAALWVEPDHRSKGHARTLLESVSSSAFQMGFPVIYLCSRPVLDDFYTHNGWTIHEQNIGPDKMSVFSKRNPDR